jgi:hypothetical protein
MALRQAWARHQPAIRPVLARQQGQRGRAGQRAAHRPRVPPPEPSGGPVGQRPGHRVGDHGYGRADAGDPAEHDHLVRRPGHRLDLVGQQHFERPEIAEVQAEIGQRDQRDPALPDPLGRLGRRAEYPAGGRDPGHDGRRQSRPRMAAANGMVEP